MRLPVSGQKRYLRSADLMNHDRAGRRPARRVHLQLLAAVRERVRPGATDHRDGSAAAHAATVRSRAGPACA